MKSLQNYIQEARTNKTAIAHFNISNIEGFWAIANAVKIFNVPVIIGVSEGERDFIGINEIVGIVKSYRERNQLPIFINADHTYSFERVKEAIDAGFDSVIFDGTELSLEENISITKKCIEYAKKVNPSIPIEAELGFIGKSSKLLDEIPDGAGKFTSIDEAKEFIEKTNIDMLAPSVGNIHGIVKTGEPSLNINKIKELNDALNIPLVLHGASGNSDSDIRESIKAGICIIHINTELRLAYKNGLIQSLKDNPNELSPYKYLKVARDSMQKVIVEKIKLFNNLDII